MIAQDVKGKKTATITLLSDLASSAHDYAKISDYSLWPDDSVYDTAFEDTLKELQLFRVTQCNPVLLNSMHHFQSSKDIAKVFRIVANFSFRYFIIGNQSPGNLERISNRIAAGIRTGQYGSPKEVADDFRAVNPDTTFKSDFALALMPRARARLARYALWRLTNFMSKQSSRSGAEQIANPDGKQVTLEHVLPQSPSSSWRTDFSKNVDSDDYVYRIGNLTLLTASVNRDAANTSFVKKQELALNGSGLAINRSFRGFTRWGDKEIEQRQLELAKTALEVWRL